jgi:hypothetical protein
MWAIISGGQLKILNRVKHVLVRNVLNKRLPLENSRIQGFMDEDDSYFLYVSVLFSQPKSILEIGHYLGKSSAAICQAIRDGGFTSQFDSFDLPYQSETEFEDYYTTIHKREIIASDAYASILRKGEIFTNVARKNLANINLSSYVNFYAQDFRESTTETYDLIFADILHDKDEIHHNINDVLTKGNKDSLYMFDDMKAENIHLIESITNLKLIRKTGKVGAFRMKK